MTSLNTLTKESFISLCLRNSNTVLLLCSFAWWVGFLGYSWLVAKIGTFKTFHMALKIHTWCLYSLHDLLFFSELWHRTVIAAGYLSWCPGLVWTLNCVKCALNFDLSDNLRLEVVVLGSTVTFQLILPSNSCESGAEEEKVKVDSCLVSKVEGVTALVWNPRAYLDWP